MDDAQIIDLYFARNEVSADGKWKITYPDGTTITSDDKNDKK